MTTAAHDDVAVLAARSEELSAEELVQALVERFGPRISLACSFQKEESVLLDMLFAADPAARVLAIDTHHLFPETYELWREVERRYDTKIEVFEGPSAADLAATHGESLWERKPELYLAIAKVEPLVRALANLDCWITGDPPRTVVDARERPEARLGRAARALEGKPARRLDRAGLLGVHPRARASLQRVARPRLRLDRRHPLDASGRRPRGPLGAQRPDRVRTAHDMIQVQTPVHRSHLDELEAEAIHIMRELAAELERPVLLFSGGKDSIVLLRLAEKAFRPGKFPFPVMHVDTGHNFPEVIEYRDRRVTEIGETLIVASVQESIDQGRASRRPALAPRATNCRP